MENQVILSFLELTLAIVLGVLSMFITHFILVRIYKSKYPTEAPYKNNAFLIFLAGTMFSVAYLLAGIIEPYVGSRSSLSKYAVSRNDNSTEILDDDPVFVY